MRNINILSGRGIILSGDRQRAGTYVGIAKRRMFEMKQMMKMGKLQYMKRSYYLDRDCVWVRLWSIDGADFIRIHSCAEGVKCELKLTATDLGSNQVQLDFTYETDVAANFYRIDIDSGGVNLSGNTRYSSITGIDEDEVKATLTRTLTFLAPGEYEIKSYASESVSFVTHTKNWPPPTGVTDYEVNLAMGDITKASLRMFVTTLSGQPSTVLVNDIAVPVAATAAFSQNVLATDLEIIEPMNIKVATVGDVLRSLSIIFTEVECFPSVTKIITVT